MSTSLQRFLRPRGVRCSINIRCYSTSQRYGSLARPDWPQATEFDSPQPREHMTDNDARIPLRRVTPGFRSTPPPRVSQPRRAPASPPSTRGNAPGVKIHVDGIPRVFSPILLRDLCECPYCLDPSTKQKYRPTTDISPGIQPRSVTETEAGVSLTWTYDVPGLPEDHVTNISIDVLRSYANSGVPSIADLSPGPRTLWDRHTYSLLPDIPYEDYMSSSTTLLHTLRQLHTHGLAFLTGVPSDPTSVSTIAERIGPLKNTFYGSTWDVRSVPNSTNVAYTSQDLGFHMDLLYMEQPPHLQLLHCIRSASPTGGGASLFTDAYRALSDLSHADLPALHALRDHPVNFHYNHPASGHMYAHSRPVLNIRRDALRALAADRAHRALNPGSGNTTPGVNLLDHITGMAWSPPFQAPLGHRQPSYANRRSRGGGPLAQTNVRVGEWHAAARKFGEMVHRAGGVYERMMRPGECVLFDNRRVLHARRAFEVGGGGEEGQERWLRGAYLDRDPFLSRLRVLEREVGTRVGGGEGVGVEGGEAVAEAA